MDSLDERLLSAALQLEKLRFAWPLDDSKPRHFSIQYALTGPDTGLAVTLKEKAPSALFVQDPLLPATYRRVACDICGRDSFKSMTGFSNHYRIQHQVPWPRLLQVAVGVRLFELAEGFHTVPASELPTNAILLPPVRSPTTYSFFNEKMQSRASGKRAMPEAADDEYSSNSAKRTKAEPEAPVDTRFYKRKRVFVGSTTVFLPPAQRTQPNCTHKWMVYLRGPPDARDISPFVQKVRFFLHPSYAPNDAVEIDSPPFYLAREGWGDFPLRVQLIFRDKSNSPTDIIYNLTLRAGPDDGTVNGGEKAVDLELSRTWFDAQPDQPRKELFPSGDLADPHVAAYLQATAKEFPLISTQGPHLPYTVATSESQWVSWTPGERASREWLRAACLRKSLRLRLGIEVSTTRLLDWARQHSLSPPLVRYCCPISDPSPFFPNRRPPNPLRGLPNVSRPYEEWERATKKCGFCNSSLHPDCRGVFEFGPHSFSPWPRLPPLQSPIHRPQPQRRTIEPAAALLLLQACKHLALELATSGHDIVSVEDIYRQLITVPRLDLFTNANLAQNDDRPLFQAVDQSKENS